MLPVATVAATSLLSGFGQFAFGNHHTLPAFDVSPEQFTARATNGFAIKLGPEREGFVVKRLSRFGKVLAIRPKPNAPTEIGYEATSLGFTLRYVSGMEWSAEGVDPPFITWDEGTVGPGVPSAPSRWAVLSWRKERTPLFLYFSNPASLIASKTSTGFALVAEGYTGTVRVRLPYGSEALETASAADFGKMATHIREMLPVLSAAAPSATASKVTAVAGGFEVSVTFDSPGAVVPPAAVAAEEKGLAKVLSPLVENSPKGMPLCATPELRVFVRAPGQMLPGIPIVQGRATGTAGGPAEDRLLAYITGNARSEDVVALSQVQAPEPKWTEPFTKIAVPVASDGSGTYAACLRGAELAAQGMPAGFLDGVFAGVDWVTWLAPGATPQEQADAAAALALAGPFCRSIDNRALAAMANAGVALPTGFDAVRQAIYGNGAPWLTAAMSPVRILTPGIVGTLSVTGIQVGGTAETVESFDLTMVADTELQTAASENVSRTMVIGGGEQTTVRIWPKKAGEWTVTFRREAGGRPIPKGAPSPRYNAGPH